MESGAVRRDEEELARILHQSSDPGPILAFGDFSPGPWWGFNGIRTLVVTSSALLIQRKSWLGGSSSKVTTLRLGDLRKITFGVRRRAGGESVRLTVTTGGLPKTFTSKYREALTLAETLEARVQALNDGTPQT